MMQRTVYLIIAIVFMSMQSIARDSPNIILIVADNLGYGDLGCYGSTMHRTPHLDAMAAAGTRLTSFYVSSGVCTPSRASIMTGCYPMRVNMHVSDIGHLVLQPVSPKGLHPDEETIAEVLKRANYSTTIIGKWHLGDQLELLPTRQGFDSYLGIPYSDDMTPREGKPWPPLPLMKNEKVFVAGVDRNELTKRYTEAAQDYIRENADHPFFLYMPQAMPGSTKTPYASQAFRGKSANGPYGDSVEELDWSLGQMMQTLQECKLTEKTLVIWTSDNGAPRRVPPQGSNLPLKGYGYDTSEGAMRVPCLMQWTGQIPAGSVNDALCSTMDLLPTFASLANVKLDEGRKIDGKNCWEVFRGRTPFSPHKAFYYYFQDQLQAVRGNDHKLYLPLGDRSINSRQKGPHVAELYNLKNDLGETKNIADQYPHIVKRLTELADEARTTIGDHGMTGSEQRPAAMIDNPTARVLE